MSWLVVISGYLLGAIPTAYIAGRLLRGEDIRQMGDGNAGAANAWRELGVKAGIAVFSVDVGKGFLAILIAQAAGVSQMAILVTGTAAVIGHNWPVFTGFRGGRGESTTIGILLTLLFQPMLIVAVPAISVLLLRKNVTLASAFLFIPLPLVCWWYGTSGILVVYSLALPSLVGVTHFLRTRQATVDTVSHKLGG